METGVDGLHLENDLSLPTTEVRFISNEILRKIADKFPQVPFNVEEVMRRTKELVIKRGAPKEDNLVGLLAEAHVTYALEQLAEDLNIDLSPIKTPSKSRKYLFVRESDTGNITAIEKRGHGGMASTAMEYDGIIMAAGLPTFIDVRTSAQGDSKGKKNKYTLNNLLNGDILRAKIKPLRDRFPLARNFGCIVVGSQEAVGTSGMRKKAFAEKGMILLSLPIPLEDLRIHASTLHSQLQK